MLPSSPPLQLRSPTARSRSPSDFSLDLDALPDGEESSIVATPLPRAKLDVVNSDDIDGPTDFTQNLEYWMTAKLPIPQQHTSRDKPPTTAAKSPPLNGVDTAVSTPRTVEHAPLPKKKELQASVEDHEDTPSRMHYSSSTLGPVLRSPELTQNLKNASVECASKDDDVDEESETVKSLREALEKLRAELDEVRTQSQEHIVGIRREYEEQLKHQEDEANAQLKAQESFWQQRLDNISQEHEQRSKDVRIAGGGEEANIRAGSPAIDSQSAEEAKHIAALEIALEHEREQLKDAHYKIAELSQRLEETNDKYNAALERHTQEIESTKAERESLRARCKEVEASKRAAENKVESLQAELANIALEHANEIEVLSRQVEDSVTAKATQRAALRQHRNLQSTALADLERENARLHGQLDAKDDEIENLQEQVSRLEAQLSAATEEKENAAAQKLREQKALNEQAAREIQSLGSRAKILQAKLDDAAACHAAAVNKLEAQVAQANSARLESDAEVDRLKVELSRVKEEYEFVNKAMDKRMQEIMKAREKVWEERMQMMKKEMALRGEVLLREWGVRELGTSEPQKYRYKYV
ncbi:uncharacterized protein PV09_07085 [Verruconis gallopava]|uniref:Uncharacterized protein n=1 Tax=Verruconis gallopava TaxID=253628 RepID=A0A0D2AR00_9PEZI|nr:uncharacterized protein PV09_07085 [Verruconis gallopava]KIW01614.1 hypothetical protein PV09_07085 [Verruconis gallopava]